MSKQENAKADNPNELITGHPFTFTGCYRSDNVEICGQCMNPESSHKFEETSELASTSANQPEPSLRDYLRGKSFKIGFAAMGPDKGYLTDESIDELISLFQADKEAAVREAYNRGYNTGWQKSNRRNDDSRLPHVANQLRQILESIDGTTHPQAGEPDDLTQVSLCPVCKTMTHTHDGVCTRCGELKAGEPIADTSQTMVPKFRDHGNEGKTNDK